MFRRVVVNDQFANGMSMGGSFLLVPGIFFVGLGVLILIMPELLAVMVASVFILIGAFFLSIALKAKRVKRDFQKDFQTWDSEQ